MELVSRMFSAASADDQKAGRQAARLVCLPGEEAKEAPKHTPPSHDTATRTQSHLKRHPTVSTTRAHSSRKRHSHVLASETCISERIVHPSLALPYDAVLKHRQHRDSASPRLQMTSLRTPSAALQAALCVSARRARRLPPTSLDHHYQVSQRSARSKKNDLREKQRTSSQADGTTPHHLPM